MDIISLAAIIVSLSAIFAYINHRFIKLPTTIGVLLIALVLSLAIVGLDKFGVLHLAEYFSTFKQIDFNKTLMQGMLSFLLFAGALHVNLEDLAREKWVVSLLATLGVVVSTVLNGVFVYYLCGYFGLQIPFIFALLFGSLISPTDPIAVIGILKKAGISKSLQTQITGESLFNDGVGVVIFSVILTLATGQTEMGFSDGLLLFAQEAVGGLGLGLALGFVVYHMLKSIDSYEVEILLTLGLVMGGYGLALMLHVSGPIVVVVAGLMIGNHGRVFAMSDKTREHLDTFWMLLDEIFNVVLFVLIGIEIILIEFEPGALSLGLAVVPLVIMARVMAIGGPIMLMSRFRKFPPKALRIMTWAGLRGGISIALALSIPRGEHRDLLLTMTYVVVIFSILVQGLTLGRLAKSK